MWQRLGLTREAMAGRPHKEVAEYLLIVQLIRREEDAAARRNRRG
jgi:hypothetical protein